MESATYPVHLQRAGLDTEHDHNGHSLAEEIACVLQEAMPHASTVVRFVDPVTGCRHSAARTTDRAACDDLLEQILTWQQHSLALQKSIEHLNQGSRVNCAAVPIESPGPQKESGFLAAFSHNQDFPSERDRAVLKMAAVAVKSALSREDGAARRNGQNHLEQEASKELNYHGRVDDAYRRLAGRTTLGDQRPEYMAALGTLAAGLSHDLGNLLLPIRLRLATIESRMKDSEFSQEFGAIRSCLDSMQRLTHGLELFSLNPENEAADEGNLLLHEWWFDVEPFMRNALPEGVALVADIPKDLPRVNMARHLLAQAVLNLIQNAGEALKNRANGKVRVFACASEGHATVSLHIADDGPGMTDEVHARCFEPFFTTKTRAISTGLGLSLVHGIIKRVHGRIDIQTQEGQGTSIELTLPVVKRILGESPAPCLAILSIRDARLRGFVSSFLKTLGLNVQAEPGPPSGTTAALWATDDAEEATRSAATFLNGSNRCVVVIGPWEEGLDDPRIVSLGDKLDRAGLSRALRQCAQRVRRTPSAVNTMRSSL